MKNQWTLALTIIVISIAALPVAAAERDQGPIQLTISTLGNDSWSGRLSEPNEAKTDGPFATLARARNEIRSIKKSASLRSQSVTVTVRGGLYSLEEPFELGSGDSGTETSPIVYTSSPGEDVRLTGGTSLTGFKPVTDDTALERLDIKARGNILQTDLKSLGITDYGPPNGGGAELFFDDRPMMLARWPNEDFVRITDTVVKDGHQIHGHKGSKVGQFKYDGDRPKRWTEEKDPWLHGYWFWDWSS